MISETKKDLIAEALYFWYNNDPKNFTTVAEKNGWEVDNSGVFKTCVRKKSIVVKFTKRTNYETYFEIKREFEQYQLIPKQFKKYFPKIHFFDGNILIQDKVMRNCAINVNCNVKVIVKELKKQGFNIYDYWHNHGHSLSGTVKFFDWVYNRRQNYVNDDKVPLDYYLKRNK